MCIRDSHYGDAESYGRRYTLIDTGGFDPVSEDPMRRGIKRQIDAALAEADVLVCVLDAREPVTAIDHAEMDLLRAAQKPVIYVAIIGRPNAGKSSLVNRLAGVERMLVDAQPGTTRDPIDTLIERDDKRLLF